MTAVLDENQRAWLTLSLVPGVGTTHFIRLLARFHTPVNVLAASEAALRDVTGPALAQRIRAYKNEVDLDAQLRALEKYGARLYTLDDPGYPSRLAEIYDPPLSLFARGDLLEEDACCVAIVGTRKPTPYGVTMASRLGHELAARGVTVVSGMAAGIDAAAHQGALDAGGRTIAVLGCGVDIVYPAENAELMHRIALNGAVVSSFPMGVGPSKGHFPYRNRIISGIALGTVVVEAPPGSGALLTAKNAAEQGREVFAVPGHVGQRNSMGPHSLLREGAKLVETVEDILVELDLPPALRVAPQQAAAAEMANPPAQTAIELFEEKKPAAPSPPKPPTPAPAPKPKPPALSKTEHDVLRVLSPEGSFVDEIALACRIPVSEALATLTLLELKGAVRQFSGKRFAPK